MIDLEIFICIYIHICIYTYNSQKVQKDGQGSQPGGENLQGDQKKAEATVIKRSTLH